MEVMCLLLIQEVIIRKEEEKVTLQMELHVAQQQLAELDLPSRPVSFISIASTSEADEMEPQGQSARHLPCSQAEIDSFILNYRKIEIFLNFV